MRRAALPRAAVDVAVCVGAPHAAVGVGVAYGGGVLHVALQGVVSPHALKRGARGRGELTGPVPQPRQKVALEDVAVRVAQPPRAAALAADKLTVVPLAVRLHHQSLAVRHAALGLPLGRAHTALVHRAVRVPG